MRVRSYFMIKFNVFLSNNIVASLFPFTNFIRYVIKELPTKEAIGREPTSFLLG